MIPWLTLASSTKLVSVVSVIVNLESVNANLSLSAPAAFSLVVPVELSCNEVSVDELTILSVMVIPIL